ncbi:MAG TPA: hypothetical protein VFM18_17610 [Methanosarcina sp.]|nr:hypothetical protein [Methanosarcina sp.]
MTTEIRAGSYIKIPKGTKVLDYAGGEKEIITKRDSVAKVDYVRTDNFQWVGRTRVSQPSTVHWGTYKHTELANVIAVEAPAPRKKPAESKKKIQLRTRMVKGSKWRLTQEAQVMKAVPVSRSGARGHTWIDHELAPDYKLPVGTEITITGKSTTYGPAWTSGIWFPVLVNDSKKPIQIEYKELNKQPEQVGEAEIIPMFVIRDTKTGMYYTGYEYSYYDWRTESTKGSNSIGYSDKLTKAKKFRRLADARVHALIQSGYYDNLPESWGSVPEWMCGRKLFNVPDTWEIVKMDKVTKSEVERIELVDTYKRSWRLRELTVKFSSAVRKVYSDLEKKNKLDEWSAIMMFKKKNTNGYGYWADELDPDDIAEINELLGRFGNDVKVQKGTAGFAVAIKDAMTATLVRLAYQGNLECAIIDFTEMKEVVKE